MLLGVCCFLAAENDWGTEFGQHEFEMPLEPVDSLLSVDGELQLHESPVEKLAF